MGKLTAAVSVTCFILFLSLISLPFVIADTNNSIIQNSLLWKQTVPTFVVNQQDFEGNHWSYNESQAFGDPTIAGGVVYIGNTGGEDGGNVKGTYAYNAYTGQKLWNQSLAYPAEGSNPVIVNGVVYIGSYNGLYALSASDGSKLWNFSDQYFYNATEGGPIYTAYFASSPLVSGGVVYAVSCNGDLLALNAQTGKLQWSSYIAKGTGTWPWYATFTSPVLADGRLFVGSQDHSVYALSASDGKKIWNFTTGAEVYAAPTVSNGVVYVCSFDGNVYALNAANGHKLWNFTAAPNSEGICFIQSTPAIAGGDLYVSGANQLFYALNANTGVELWGFNTTGGLSSSPIVVNGAIYVGSESGVYAISSEGKLLCNYTTDGPASSPAISNGILYVGTTTGSVYAFGTATPWIAATQFVNANRLFVVGVACVVVGVSLVAVRLRSRQVSKEPL